MAKISGLIIATNQEKHIAKIIDDNNHICEEIIFIDGGSTDNSLKVAQDLGAKIYSIQQTSLIERKILGENLCKNNWILNLNINDELSKELQDEIEFIFSANIQDKYHAYRNGVISSYYCGQSKFFTATSKNIIIYNRLHHSFSKAKKSSLNNILECNLLEDKIYDLSGNTNRKFNIAIVQLLKQIISVMLPILVI